MDLSSSGSSSGLGIVNPNHRHSPNNTNINNNTTNNNNINNNNNTTNDDPDDAALTAAALAAHAAAQALSDHEKAAVHQPPCAVCGRHDARPLLRFLPVAPHHDVYTAAPGVTTFGEDVALHLFCGKTASILPHVQQRPDLEILTKAGLKNKHGIGPEVNAALARTRSALLLDTNSHAGEREKPYYLVREFEAHLAAIRHAHLPVSLDHPSIPPTQQQSPLLPNTVAASSKRIPTPIALQVQQQQQQPSITANTNHPPRRLDSLQMDSDDDDDVSSHLVPDDDNDDAEEVDISKAASTLLRQATTTDDEQGVLSDNDDEEDAALVDFLTRHPAPPQQQTTTATTLPESRSSPATDNKNKGKPHKATSRKIKHKRPPKNTTTATRPVLPILPAP